MFESLSKDVLGEEKKPLKWCKKIARIITSNPKKIFLVK